MIELWGFIPPIVLIFVNIFLLLPKIYNSIFIPSIDIEGALVGFSSFSLMFFTLVNSYDK